MVPRLLEASSLGAGLSLHADLVHRDSWLAASLERIHKGNLLGCLVWHTVGDWHHDWHAHWLLDLDLLLHLLVLRLDDDWARCVERDRIIM